MSGYVFVLGNCIVCKLPFSFNPVRVPSTTAITGEREPICSKCIVIVNEGRRARRLPEWPIPADAYEPVSESEL
jgi:hypothetical protein